MISSYPMMGNDPIDSLLQAFAALHPAKSKILNPYYNWEMKRRKKEFGRIVSNNENEIKIALCPELPVMQVAETLLVLLAEVVAGDSASEVEFQNAATKIQGKYVEILESLKGS